jgi:hypothetical protein
MLVNISGSFVIGFFATLTGLDGRLLVSATARQFVMIGLFFILAMARFSFRIVPSNGDGVPQNRRIG